MISHMHYEIEQTMEPEQEVSFTGCLVQVSEGTNVDINFAIGNNCADIPEKKDMVCVKYGKKIMHLVQGVM